MLQDCSLFHSTQRCAVTLNPSFQSDFQGAVRHALCHGIYYQNNGPGKHSLFILGRSSSTGEAIEIEKDPFSRYAFHCVWLIIEAGLNNRLFIHPIKPCVDFARLYLARLMSKTIRTCFICEICAPKRQDKTVWILKEFLGIKYTHTSLFCSTQSVTWLHIKNWHQLIRLKKCYNNR